MVKKFLFYVLLSILVLIPSITQNDKRLSKKQVTAENTVINSKIYLTLGNGIKLRIFARSIKNDNKTIYFHLLSASLYEKDIEFIAENAIFDLQNKNLKLLNQFEIDIHNKIKIKGKEILIYEHFIKSDHTIDFITPHYFLTAESMILNIKDISVKLNKPLLKILK